MKLEQIKCNHLSRCKNIAVSPSYIIGCSGRRAVILDRSLNLVHTFDKLDYVYCAYVSPDENKLLLVSTSNVFYIADIATRQIQKVTVKRPYNLNMEGLGCWSHDGKSVYISIGIQSSTLRKYQVDNLSLYEDFLLKKYYINDIHPISNGKYLIVGHTRSHDHISFIHFDGANIEEHPINDTKNLTVFDSNLNIFRGNVGLSTNKGYFVCSLHGELISKITHPAPITKTIHFLDIFKRALANDPEKREEIRKALEPLGNNSVEVNDDISKCDLSACGKYLFIASESGFYVADADTSEIIAEVPEEFGSQNFEQLSPDTIAFATWGTVKLYRMVEEI